MERLTLRSPIDDGVLIKDKYKSSYTSPCFGCEKIGHCSKCAEIKVAEKLAEYEDLEEQGLLLRPPCKIGDTVYTVNFGEIQPQKVGRIIIADDGMWLYDNHYRVIENVNNIFFIKSRAEQALAKMKSEAKK